MSQKLNDPSAHRDYGATADTAASTASTLPDVNYAGLSGTEFVSLSEDVAHSMKATCDNWKQLEKLLKLIGTPRDQTALRDKIHGLHTRTNALIEATSRDLQRLTTVVRRGDRQQRLQLEKLTADFGAVVEGYGSVQQRITAAIKHAYTEQVARADDEALADDDELQRQQLTTATLKLEHDLLVDRERQIRQLEATILDVNAIMRTVNEVVHKQSEDVDNIETSIENAAAEIELGRSELAKASARRQSYRRKILILLVIAVIIGLIVTGIIVGKL